MKKPAGRDIAKTIRSRDFNAPTSIDPYKPNTNEKNLDGPRFKNKLTAGFSTSLQTYSLEKFMYSLERHITS